MFQLTGQVADAQVREVKGGRKIVNILLRDPIDGGVLPVQWWPQDAGEVLRFGDSVAVTVRGVEAFNRSAHLVAHDVVLLEAARGNGHGQADA